MFIYDTKQKNKKKAVCGHYKYGDPLAEEVVSVLNSAAEEDRYEIRFTNKELHYAEELELKQYESEMARLEAEEAALMAKFEKAMENEGFRAAVKARGKEFRLGRC